MSFAEKDDVIEIEIPMADLARMLMADLARMPMADLARNSYWLIYPEPYFGKVFTYVRRITTQKKIGF